MPTLYYAPGTCALVTHIALEEAGAPYEAVRLDFSKGEQRSPEFLAINPHGRVPALVTDEGTITENLAILGYIADQHGADGSVPRGNAFETARTMQLLSWLSGTVHGTAFAGLFRPGRFSQDEAAQKAIAEGAHANLTSHSWSSTTCAAAAGWPESASPRRTAMPRSSTAGPAAPSST